MCVGCRGTAPKAELVRVVKDADDRVFLDATGSAPGRGAYVHPTRECVEPAVRKGALARALRASMGPDEVSNLLREIEREALE